LRRNLEGLYAILMPSLCGAVLLLLAVTAIPAIAQDEGAEPPPESAAAGDAEDATDEGGSEVAGMPMAEAEPEAEGGAGAADAGDAVAVGLASPPPPLENLKAFDWPNDEGGSLAVTWSKAAWEDTGLDLSDGSHADAPFFVIEWGKAEDGPWFEAARVQAGTQFLKDDEGNFGFFRAGHDTTHFARAGLAAGEETVADGTPAFVRIGIAPGESAPAAYYFPQTAQGAAANNWWNKAKTNQFIILIFLCAAVLAFISKARRGIELYIRRIAGLEAVDEAIGRATEMGRTMFYLCGLGYMSDVSTIAATNILGRVARKVAEYESQLKVPCFDPIVMSVCQEVVKQGYIEAGRPDNYNEDNVFFLTQEQFSYVSSVNGMMSREKPAANFYFGYYYAESLLLAEAGNQVGAIQIAGTDALVQIPFFICACDYTLIGEELYAASAYISREPKLLGSIKAIDMAKAVIIFLIVIGSILGSLYAITGNESLRIVRHFFTDF